MEAFDSVNAFSKRTLLMLGICKETVMFPVDKISSCSNVQLWHLWTSKDHLQLLLLVEEQAIVLQKDLPFKTSLWRSFAPEMEKLRCVVPLSIVVMFQHSAAVCLIRKTKTLVTVIYVPDGNKVSCTKDLNN